MDSLSGLFEGTKTALIDFNGNVGAWDISAVTSMFQTFQYCTFGNTHSIADWDTSNVVTMEDAFYGATNFDQALNWDTSRVVYFHGMFRDAPSFNQAVSAWDTSAATDMEGMFRGATSFNQDAHAWDVSKVGAASSTSTTSRRSRI